MLTYSAYAITQPTSCTKSSKTDTLTPVYNGIAGGLNGVCRSIQVLSNVGARGLDIWGSDLRRCKSFSLNTGFFYVSSCHCTFTVQPLLHVFLMYEFVYSVFVYVFCCVISKKGECFLKKLYRILVH
jgi:hypothetical protein